MKRFLVSTIAFLAVIGMVFARSEKRGFGENTLYYSADLKVLAKGCSWFYNWGPQPASQIADLVGADNVIEFVPMAWNGGFDESQLKAYYDAHPQDKYLLGFNEPNFKEQSNMTPEDAVEPWYKLEQFAKANNLKLIAPALNYSSWTEYSTPDKWMDAFIAAYKEKYGTEPSYDYLALHCYMDDPTAVIDFVENYAKKYGKQVWLTEFCAWESTSLTAETQQELMIEKLQRLETSDYVFRYAWFKARNSNTYPYYNLVEYPVKSKGIYSGTLTSLGFAYVHMSTYDLDKYYDVDERIPANAFVNEKNLESIKRSIDPCAIDSTEVYLHGSGCELTYQINVPTAGDYYLVLRYSSPSSSLKSRINILDESGNALISEHNLPNTDGEDVYSVDTTIKLSLKAGKQKITIQKDNAKASNLTLLKLVKQIDLSDEDLQTMKGEPFDQGGSSGGGGDDPETPGTGEDTTTVEDIKITDAITSPYAFSDNNKYYCLYLDETTRQANVSDDRYVNCGDNGTSQNSYVWESTFKYGDVTGENSFGVTGNYISLIVTDKGWSGMGYNVNADKGDLDLSCVNVDYTLHMALKSESTESFDFYITDGQNHTAHLVFGATDVDGHAPIGNFKRDGKWHNVDIPMSYLQSQCGINFNRDTDYDGNLLCLNAGATAGTTIAYDAIFFYGPKDSKPDADISGFDISVIDIPEGAASEFNFAQSNKYYGIYLDEETRNATIDDDRYVNCGDNGTSQNSYLWENTFKYGTASGPNSFGVEGAYMSLVVNNSSWTGMGYNVAASATPLNLSAISSDYILHFAVKATHSEPIEFVLNDGQRDAQIVLGQSAFDGHEALADFQRDGLWHEIYVPLKYLNSKFGTNFSSQTNYTGNIFVIRTTAVMDNTVDYDAVFIYGPASSTGIESEELDNRTISIAASSENPHQFSADNDYYIISLDSETRSSNLTSDQITDLGPDDVTRHLYPWDDTFTAGTATDDNSFGVAGSYESWIVSNKGWSGLGYNIAEGVDLSGINSQYTLHLAVKTNYTGTIEFYVTDGNSKVAYLPLGDEAFEGNTPIGNFERNNSWYNVDIPVSYLVKHGLDFRTASYYTGNILCLLAGGVEGTVVDFDAVFFYGPSKTTQGIDETIRTNTTAMEGVKVYSMNGILVGTANSLADLDLGKGLYIVRSANGTKKVLVK